MVLYTLGHCYTSTMKVKYDVTRNNRSDTAFIKCNW